MWISRVRNVALRWNWYGPIATATRTASVDHSIDAIDRRNATDLTERIRTAHLSAGPQEKTLALSG